MVELDLSYKQLTEIPEIPNDTTRLILKLIKLQKLKKEIYLMDYYFDLIIEISGLKKIFTKKLKTLILDCNKIDNLDNFIFPCKLNQLRLWGNFITELKPNIFPSQLEVLNLDCNQIENLKVNTFPKKLKVLSLWGNKIQKLMKMYFLHN